MFLKSLLPDLTYLLLAMIGVLLIVSCSGCICGETGSRTVIGNHFALPKLASASGEIELNIYESTEGAVVTTRKDSRVEISYSNTYTNHIFGIYDKIGVMNLTVAVEPLSVEEAK